MITVNYGTKQLYMRLQSAQNLLKETKDPGEKIALANYIGNIYTAIMSISGKKVSTNKKRIFGSSKNYNKFLKKLSLYEDKMIDKYLKDKDFHKDLFESLLDGTDPYVDYFIEFESQDMEQLKKSDYDDIIFMFMKSLKQEKFFEEYFKNNCIYSNEKSDKNHYLGSIAFNPVNKDMDIFVGNFNYNLNSLFVLVHEFGHAYELDNFNEDISSYNRYFYQSFYSEVFSIMYERLLIDFMFKNNILVEDTKDKLIEMELNHHDYLTSCYLISLFDDYHIATYKNEKMKPNEIYNIVKDDFDEGIIEFLEEDDNLVVGENYSYGYGDFISMFLKDRVLEEGFSNKLIEDFFKVRSGLFDRDFLDKYEMDSNNYMDLYKKEVQFVKK